MQLLRSFAIALSMYSKIPVPMVEWNEKNMKYAMCFFPVIGAVIGGIQLLAAYVLNGYTSCGRFFTAVVMTLIPVAVTGGIHLDGFTDTVDALSSYGDREKKLEILKDPNTGAFAVIWLCAYFAAALGLWTELPAGQLPVAACTYVISRSLSGISVVTFHAAKNSGLLKTFQDGAQKRRVRVVLIIWACAAAAVMIRLSVLSGIAAVLAAGIIFFYYYRMSRKQFGGITGDLAGYFLQVCELAMLAAVVLSSIGFVK